jgi:hypothetical protein
MNGNRAFDLLASPHRYFREDEARDLAISLGVVWDGFADSTLRNGEYVYSSQALSRSFATATRCRPLGGTINQIIRDPARVFPLRCAARVPIVRERRFLK